MRHASRIRAFAHRFEEEIMNTVVIGGSGLIGSKVVERLRARGHEVIAASPASGVDTMRGKGLQEGLQDAREVAAP
jgi:uncharacterized protein YbjT (DUF2867 family)